MPPSPALPAPGPRRPARAGLGAVAARLCAAAAAALTLAAAPAVQAQARGAARDTRPTVAVLYFNNGSLVRHAEFEPLSKGIGDMLAVDLARNPRLRLVERDQLQRALDEIRLNTTDRVDPETAVRVGRILGAHYILFGGFVVDPRGRMRIAARAMHVETSRIDGTESVERHSDDVLDMIDELARKLNKNSRGLRDTPPPPPPPPDPEPAAPDTAPPPPADPGRRFRALMLYSRALAEEDAGRRPQAAALYRSALAQHPDYGAARSRLRRLAQGS